MDRKRRRKVRWIVEAGRLILALKIGQSVAVVASRVSLAAFNSGQRVPAVDLAVGAFAGLS